jgi:RNA polymerase sigma-70 factor (ECF subfamily)
MRRLVERHGGRLYACALRMLGDAGAAEEIVQDAFATLVRTGSQFRHGSSIGTWLYTVTMNRCRDARRRAAFGAAAVTAPVDDTMPDAGPGPLELTQARDREERLRAAIARLPDEMREVIVLRFASGRSYEEIAQLVGCATGTIASRIHRALQRLGDELRATGLTRESL